MSEFVPFAAVNRDAHEETIAVVFDVETMRQLAASDAELARGEGETLKVLTTAMERRRESS